MTHIYRVMALLPVGDVPANELNIILNVKTFKT